MADKKIIGKLENIITFSVNKASLNKALASIKKVKDAMKAAVSPIASARNSTMLDPALKRQKDHTRAIREDRNKDLADQKQHNKNIDRLHRQALWEDKRRSDKKQSLRNRRTKPPIQKTLTQKPPITPTVKKFRKENQTKPTVNKVISKKAIIAHNRERVKEQQVKPSLIVQKQLDKTEKSQLKTAESLYRARDKQALAEQKIANQRRAQSVRGLTAKSGAGRASQTAFADILRGEGRQSASELKRQRELNRAHTQAIIEDRKRDLNNQKQFNKLWDEEMNRVYNERKKDVLKRHNAARKERRTRWKQEERDLKEMNRLHGQALSENMKRDQKIKNLYDRRRQAVLSARESATAKRIARREREQLRSNKEQGAANNRNMRFDRRAQATQEWFGTTFGRGGQRKATGLYNDLRAGKINAEQYSTRLRTLRGDLYRSQRAQRSFNQSIHDMRGAFVQATASYTAFAGVTGIANIGKQYESRYAGMLVGTGSAEQARSQISYLDKEVYRLGLDIGIASQGLVQMSVAANGVMSNGQIQGLFTGLSELSTAVKLDPFRYEKAIMAISQMLNKGQLMAEEVKSQ